VRFKRFAVVAASLCVTVAVLAAPVQAAETPTSDAYGGAAGQVGSGGGETDPSGTESSQSAAPNATGAEVSEASTGSVLPFTGLQMGIIAVVGIALFGAGLALRRTARPGRLG